MVRSELGSAPLISLNYYLQKLLPLITFGTMTILTTLLATLLLVYLKRNYVVFIGFGFAIAGGIFIDLWNLLIDQLALDINRYVWLPYLMLFFGLNSLSIGITVTMMTKIPPSPFEDLLSIIYLKTQKMAWSKVILEAILLLLALIFGFIYGKPFEQLSLFTLVVVLLNGPIVAFYHRLLKNLGEKL
jgi:uncharacterized membrane protein YczE